MNPEICKECPYSQCPQIFEGKTLYNSDGSFKEYGNSQCMYAIYSVNRNKENGKLEYTFLRFRKDVDLHD